MHINYWSGKTKKDAVVLPIKTTNSGDMVCLMSEKLAVSDVKKLKASAIKIAKMDGDEFEHWLKMHLPSTQSAIKTMKRGRYEIVQEYPISG